MKIRISKFLLGKIKEDSDNYGVDFCAGRYLHYLPARPSVIDTKEIVLNIQDDKFNATDNSNSMFEVEYGAEEEIKEKEIKVLELPVAYFNTVLELLSREGTHTTFEYLYRAFNTEISCSIINSINNGNYKIVFGIVNIELRG